MTAPLGGHERAYRGLLRVYPREYRAHNSDQMVQLFGDQLRYDGSGRTWLRATRDLATSAVSEHMRRNRIVAQSLSMAPTPVGRALGVLGVIGGAFLLVTFLGVSINPDLFNLRLVLFNIGAVAVVLAVHLRQRTVAPRLSLVGAIPAVLANAAYLILITRLVAQPGDLGPGDYGPFIPYVAGAMWLSDLWFGVVTFRLGVLSRMSSAALVIGSTAAFAGMGVFGLQSPGSLAETVILAGIGVHGLAWILLGLEVAFRRRAVVVEER